MLLGTPRTLLAPAARSALGSRSRLRDRGWQRALTRAASLYVHVRYSIYIRATRSAAEPTRSANTLSSPSSWDCTTPGLSTQARVSQHAAPQLPTAMANPQPSHSWAEAVRAHDSCHAPLLISAFLEPLVTTGTGRRGTAGWPSLRLYATTARVVQVRPGTFLRLLRCGWALRARSWVQPHDRRWEGAPGGETAGGNGRLQEQPRYTCTYGVVSIIERPEVLLSQHAQQPFILGLYDTRFIHTGTRVIARGTTTTNSYG